MTIWACPRGEVLPNSPSPSTGSTATFPGVVDTSDFVFVGPNSTVFTLAKAASRPTVSGRTYTVETTELVGILNQDTVTASGSVTCP